MMTKVRTIKELVEVLEKIPGGYVYSGACSYQWCFPLKAGGHLRIMVCDDLDDGEYSVDLYDGFLPGLSGPTTQTGGG